MPLTYGQLPHNPKYGVSVRCASIRTPQCCETYSAHYGDYFQIPDTTPVKCGACGGAMILVQKEVKYVKLTPEQADADRAVSK